MHTCITNNLPHPTLRLGTQENQCAVHRPPCHTRLNSSWGEGVTSVVMLVVMLVVMATKATTLVR